jgi:alpha-D-xyloside xylohydrolase
MQWDDAAGVLTIGAREGSYPGMTQSRTIALVVHDGSASGDAFAAEAVQSVVYDGGVVVMGW